MFRAVKVNDTSANRIVFHHLSIHDFYMFYQYLMSARLYLSDFRFKHSDKSCFKINHNYATRQTDIANVRPSNYNRYMLHVYTDTRMHHSHAFSAPGVYNVCSNKAVIIIVRA